MEKNVTGMYGMFQTAFGATCRNRASVFEWHKRFKETRESVRDDERCGRTSMGRYRSCWNGTSALQPEEITSKGTRVSCVYYEKKCPYEKSQETYLMILVQ